MTTVCDVVVYDRDEVEQSRSEATADEFLEPWEALECTFVNDNTAFIEIIKNTTNNA